MLIEQRDAEVNATWQPVRRELNHLFKIGLGQLIFELFHVADAAIVGLHHRRHVRPRRRRSAPKPIGAGAQGGDDKNQSGAGE